MESDNGLPEGVELVDFKQAGPEDYDLSRGTDGEFHIYKGTRLGGAITSFRVKASEGYDFVQIGFEQVADIKAFKMATGRPRFEAVKKLPPTGVRIEACFVVTNQVAADAIRTKWEEIRQLVGFDGSVSSITEMRTAVADPAKA